MSKRALLDAFKMPILVRMADRTSSITNSFVNEIAPAIMPVDEVIVLATEVFGMDALDMRCSYRGDSATEWDHPNATVRTGRLDPGHQSGQRCGHDRKMFRMPYSYLK